MNLKPHSQQSYTYIAKTPFYTFAPQLQQTIRKTHSLHIPTHNPTLTIKPYKLNISDKWTNSPKTSYPLPTPPLAQTHQIPTKLYTPHPQKYNPSQSIYMNGSIIPLDWKGNRNLVGSRVYSQLNNIQIANRVPRFQNILKA